MNVEQISIFLENKSGRIDEVTSTLSEAGVNIRALSLADTSDFGVLRLIVNDSRKAKDALKEKGFTVSETEVLAVEVADRPGGLHSILNVLKQHDINVEYMYAFVQQSGNNAIMIFRFENVDEAAKILTDNGVSIVDGHTLYKM